MSILQQIMETHLVHLRAERELRRSLALFVDASWRPGIYMDGVRVHLATIACGICF